MEKYDGNSKSQSFDAVLDSAVRTIAFGIAANQARGDAGVLQVRLGGAAPGVSEHHFLFPPDCLPRPMCQGRFRDW